MHFYVKDFEINRKRILLFRWRIILQFWNGKPFSIQFSRSSLLITFFYIHSKVLLSTHCSKLEKVLDENVTPQFQYFLFIWPLVMSNLAIWQNSVGIQDLKGKKTLKKGKFWSFLANFDLVLPLKFWMPTDFNDLAYFGINNVQIDEKCWNCGVTFSSRTIFNFEQCVTFNIF